MKNTIQVAIVDDNRMFKNVLLLYFSEDQSIEVTRTANDGAEFLEQMKDCMADIVLMDVEMPKMKGIETTRRALEFLPDLKIIALSMFDNFEYMKEMKAAGAKGYLLKSRIKEEFKTAIHKVFQGEEYFPVLETSEE